MNIIYSMCACNCYLLHRRQMCLACFEACTDPIGMKANYICMQSGSATESCTNPATPFFRGLINFIFVYITLLPSCKTFVVWFNHPPLPSKNSYPQRIIFSTKITNSK